MTNTITQFISGHNVHASLEPGLTLCGKRTETLEQTDRFVSCQYCRDHMPTNRDALLGLVAAVRAEAQPGSRHVPADDIAGQVRADVRADFLNDLGLMPWDR